MLSLSHILHSFFFSLLLSLFYPLPVSSYPFFIQHLFSFAISIFISALRVPQDTPLPLPLSIHPSPYPFFPFYHFPTSANPFIANNFSLVQSPSSFLFPPFLSFFYYFPYILTLQFLSSKIYLPFSSLFSIFCFYLILSILSPHLSFTVSLFLFPSFQSFSNLFPFILTLQLFSFIISILLSAFPREPCMSLTNPSSHPLIHLLNVCRWILPMANNTCRARTGGLNYTTWINMREGEVNTRSYRRARETPGTPINRLHRATLISRLTYDSQHPLRLSSYSFFLLLLVIRG